MNSVQITKQYCHCGRALKCEGDHYCGHCLFMEEMEQEEVDSDSCDGCGEAFLPSEKSMEHLCGKCQVMESSRVGPHGTDPLTPRYVRCRIPRFQTGV